MNHPAGSAKRRDDEAGTILPHGANWASPAPRHAASVTLVPRPAPIRELPEDLNAAPVPDERPDERPGERELRHEERPHLALPVVVCGMGLNGKLFFELTRTLDVSRSGCRLHLRTRPQMDSPLAIRLIRHGEAIREETVQMLCRVVWLREDGEGWTIGAATLRNGMSQPQT